MDLPNLSNINGKGNAPTGPRPHMLMCYLCGKEFGSKSLPIHLPQCQKKWEAIEMAKHPKDRRPMPQPPAPEIPIKAGLTGGANANQAALQEFNDAAYEQFKLTLINCPFCNRKFSPEAFKHHEKACYASNPAKPAGTGLTSNSLSNNKRIKAYTNLYAASSSSGGGAGGGAAGGGGAAAPAAASASASASASAVPSASKLSRPAQQEDSSSGGKAKGGFCEECGAMFTSLSAKFCGECGAKRVL